MKILVTDHALFMGGGPNIPIQRKTWSGGGVNKKLMKFVFACKWLGGVTKRFLLKVVWESLKEYLSTWSLAFSPLLTLHPSASTSPSAQCQYCLKLIIITKCSNTQFSIFFLWTVFLWILQDQIKWYPKLLIFPVFVTHLSDYSGIWRASGCHPLISPFLP